ncbi:TPA: hypothetical protein HA241_02605 [Candidatus Woesearchaeota archaeon]|nr:hypothetical protein [Candidatus Woesearchaeota archaeon]
MRLFSKKNPFEKLKEEIETVGKGWFGSVRTPQQQFEQLIILEYKVGKDKNLSPVERFTLERKIREKRLQIELAQRR